jgi:hypothetical protein
LSDDEFSGTRAAIETSVGLVVRLHRTGIHSPRRSVSGGGNHRLAGRAAMGDCGGIPVARRGYVTIKAVRAAFLALIVNCVAFSADPVENAPDPAGIVRRSVDRDRRNFELLKNYTYTETEEDREYDKAGHLKKIESETYEIFFLGGRTYARIVARNGKPLSDKDARKEQEKLDREIRKREGETPQEKAKLEKEREKQRAFVRELPDAFDFKLVGEDVVSGKPAWVISGEPKPDYHARDELAKVVTKMRGKVWIDKSEFQWVKIQAEAIGTLSFGFGLLRIGQGSIVEFEQTRVNDEVWLPASGRFKVDGRLALLKPLHGEVELRFQDYKKFQAKSQFTVEAEQ